MKQATEIILARRLLETRDQGISYGLLLRRNAWRYLILVIYAGLTIALSEYLESWSACYLVLGIVIGCFIRDLGWFRQIKKGWPFNVKVTDWEKVQDIAEEKPVD